MNMKKGIRTILRKHKILRTKRLNLIQIIEKESLNISIALNQKDYDALSTFGRGHYQGSLDLLNWILNVLKSNKKSYRKALSIKLINYKKYI